tara:strand:- start:53 stop:331 length:279 start_codon:yes stop_codon:yes gene_type:complete
LYSVKTYPSGLLLRDDQVMQWLDDYENIWKVGMWLADDKYGWTWAKNNLAYYFEKPYKYTEEYEEWREYMDWEMENASEYNNGYDSWLRSFK